MTYTPDTVHSDAIRPRDPVFLQIARGFLQSCIREMSVLMDRTSMSPSIREKNDYAICIYDAAGHMVSGEVLIQGPGLIAPILKQYPVADVQEGDIYVYNDVYLSEGALGHLPDMAFCIPVFVEGVLSAWAAVFGHYFDIGGMIAGSLSPKATEIFQEGLMVPPTRLCRAGRWNDELYAVLLRNSRFPDYLRGDTQAMISAARLGERRLHELFARYGREVVAEALQELLDWTRRAARVEMLRLVPQGRYTLTLTVDQDPVSGRSFPIQVELVREGDRLTLDFTGSADQAPGPVNCLIPANQVHLMIGRYLQSLNPGIMLNDGLEGAVDEVRVREGSILMPRFPAATGQRSGTKSKVVNAVLGVFSQASAGAAPAGSATFGVYRLVSRSSDGGLSYWSEGFAVGHGGRSFADGLDTVYFIRQRNNPIEFLELEYPVRVERYGVHVDSGGPGQHRGGAGVVREVRILCEEAELTTVMYCDSLEGPNGVNGGRNGAAGRFIVNPGTPQEREIPPLATGIRLKRGDLLRVMGAGGGGWGNPLQRPAAAVLQDVIRGYVSVQGARSQYGVVIDPQSLSVDEPATAGLRSAVDG